MSFEIDMENYGRDFRAPAAGEQKIVEPNFYQQEVGEQPLHPELNGQVLIDEVPDAPAVNPQAENFRALREEVDRIKSEREAERREHQLQLDMLRANIDRANMQAKPQEPIQERRMFEGMQDDDVPSVAEIRKEWNQREAGYQARLEELQVQQRYPDYAEVIEKFALPLVKQKPHLAEGIQGASNKALFAYELGKMAQQMQMSQQPVQPTINENAQRLVENSRKPGTLSQAGGQATLSKADYFASMSDREFIQYANRHLEQI